MSDRPARWGIWYLGDEDAPGWCVEKPGDPPLVFEDRGEADAELARWMVDSFGGYEVRAYP